ncbi:C39 family peptidase [uncultured Clostridium sp.]|uniref:C39 family peptidase n=1 Tax=uncultured Clostridium sp. TaxID=59620 RepID=UPI00261AC350|nr:C39 family peptidase [uncultured Clostridium sp.]
MGRNKKIIIIFTLIIVVLAGAKVAMAATRKNEVGVNKGQVQIRKNIKLNTEIPKWVYDSKERYIEILRKEDSNEKIKDILANLNLYPKELVKLASYNKEAINFVYDYPFVHEYYQNTKINIDNLYEKGKIPLFIQWDEKWGYDKYGNNYIAVNGCGPTALAMVLVGLTGDTNINPKVIADYAQSNGFYVNGEGSKWSMMTDIPPHYGVKAEEVQLSRKVIEEDLKNGIPIIDCVGPGVFTKTGHFIVLTGITADGKVIVNDPDSIVKSKETWSLDIFMKESRGLWAFKKA